MWNTVQTGKGDYMTNRYEVHNMIRGLDIGETMDLEVCKSLIEKYGSSRDIELLITDNGVDMTYGEVADQLNRYHKREEILRKSDSVNDLTLSVLDLQEENEELKQENQSLLKTVSHFDTVAGADRSYAERMDEENKQLKKENKHLNYRLNDLKHEIHHLKHEQKCLIKDISFLDMSAPRAKQAIKENKQLKQFKEKVFNLINTKIEECEKDYDRAVQAGMPSMIIYDEIESLEWLKKELEE